MGACDFSSYAYGKTPAEAFDAAVDQARWEHGHGGYTGTIAEKHGFVPCDTLGLKPDVFLKLLGDAQKFMYGSYAAERARDAERWGKGARKTYMGKTLKQWQTAAAQEQRKTERFWGDVEKRKPGLRRAIERAHETFDDKWGPALCIGPITGVAEKTHMSWAVGVHTNGADLVPRKPRGAKLYLFTGMASS